MKRSPRTAWNMIVLTSAFLCASLPLPAAPRSDPELLKAVQQLQGVHAYDRRTQKRLDDAWARMEADRGSSLPILKGEMRRALAQEPTDSFFLFEGCRFLAAMEEPLDKEAVCAALERIDPGSRIVRQTTPKLFRLLLLLAQKGVRDNRLLEAMDRHFLFPDGKVKVVIPERSLNLDASSACVFLYGACFPQGEPHLSRHLKKRPQHASRILQVLSVIGTEISADAVRQCLTLGTDDETFLLGCRYLLDNGGPKGKEIFMKLSFRRLGVQAKKAAELLRAEAGETAYAGLRAAVLKRGEGSGSGRLPDADVRERLQKMAETRRWEKGTHPGAILDCTLTSRFLITELIKVRARIFQRLDNDVRVDAGLINVLLNALRYRREEWKETDR